MRLACKIKGCQLDGNGYYEPYCWRCGAELYAREFVQEGWYRRLTENRVMQYWWRLWYAFHNRCGHCGEHLWFQVYEFCNKDCENKWIPF